MLDNLIGKIMGGIAGRFLKGYATKIGLVTLALLFLVALVGKIFPDLGLPGSEMSYSDIMNAFAAIWSAFQNPVTATAAGGGATLIFGILRKFYHVGLNTPVPQSTTPPPADAGTAPTAEIQSGVIEQEITPGPPAGSGGFGPQGN